MIFALNLSLRPDIKILANLKYISKYAYTQVCVLIFISNFANMTIEV
jgi:hypothetical protein